MFVDALTLVSSGQQVTADAVSTNTIDLSAPTIKRAIGDGEPMGFAVAITAAGTNTGSADLQAISSAAANLSSATVLGLTRLATADLAVGKLFFVPLPPGTPAQQYLGLNYDITGTVDFTVKSWLTSQSMFAKQAQSYAKGYVIS
jgi:hypothetical protein